MTLPKFTITTQPIVANTRKLKTVSNSNKSYRLIELGQDTLIKRDGSYTIEIQQDLRVAHGMDIESEMMKMLQNEIRNELDKEILSKMIIHPKVFSSVELEDQDGKYKLNNGLYIPK